jgi:hypothetical protein
MNSTLFFWAASAFSAFCFAAHVFAGGKMFVAPLMQNTTIDPTIKALSYVSWHCVSLLFASFAVTFAFVALKPQNVSLAAVASLMSGATTIMIFAIALRGHNVMLKLPAVYFFGLIALLGSIGLIIK